MEISSTISAPPKRCRKNIWVIQPSKEIALCFLKKSAIILGVANKARDMSMKERLPRRKYMGE
jgi:hypothetical protein